MQEKLHNPPPSSNLAELVSLILEDTRTLLRQEAMLARVEIQSEWSKFKFGAVWLFIGGLVGMASVVLVGLALAYLMSELTSAPLSATFFLSAVVFAAVAGAVFAFAYGKLKRLRPVPDKTIDSFKENVRWIKNRL